MRSHTRNIMGQSLEPELDAKESARATDDTSSSQKSQNKEEEARRAEVAEARRAEAAETRLAAPKAAKARLVAGTRARAAVCVAVDDLLKTLNVKPSIKSQVKGDWNPIVISKSPTQ